jgi:predicted transcriptional regulator
MNLEKTIKALIKVAAVALTTPATWTVAGELYTNPVQRLLVQIAALILVEGALLLGWHMLDTNINAAPAQRWLYAVLTVVAYFVLWMVAIRHGEGLAGIGFRATLGVLIGYSVIESGILAQIKLRQRADRDITKHLRVRRAMRFYAKADALHDLARSSTEVQALREAQHDARLKSIALRRKRLLEQVDLEDQHLSEELLNGGQKRLGPPSYPALAAPNSGSRARQPTKRDTMNELMEILADNPDITKKDLAEQTGRAASTVSKYLGELAKRGKLVEADTVSGYDIQPNRDRTNSSG